MEKTEARELQSSPLSSIHPKESLICPLNNHCQKNTNRKMVFVTLPGTAGVVVAGLALSTTSLPTLLLERSVKASMSDPRTPLLLSSAFLLAALFFPGLPDGASSRLAAKKAGKMKLCKFVSIHDAQKIYITYVSIISLHNLLALTYDMT